MATPLRSEVTAFHPSKARTAAGVAQGHASARPSEIIRGSLAIFAVNSACTAPVPHAFNGSVRSVQFVVSANVDGCPAMATCPLPLLMLKNASFTVGAGVV